MSPTLVRKEDTDMEITNKELIIDTLVKVTAWVGGAAVLIYTLLMLLIRGIGIC